MTDSPPPSTAAADDTGNPGDGLRPRFWERYRLDQLTPAEWEALCDGCGQCCLLRHIDRRQLTVFALACDLLDIPNARCSDYAGRQQQVPDCTQLTPERVARFDWLPGSCAYRRLHLRQPLPDWHPLLSGNRKRMQAEGHSVTHYARPMRDVPDTEIDQHVLAVWSLEQARTALRGRRKRRRRHGIGQSS